jgi:APA family basic amino acid/polyamine antiporter
VPALGALAAVSQMLALPFDTIIRLFVWMAIGFVIYFAYGVKNSKLRL